MISPNASQNCSNPGICESELPEHHQRHKKNGGNMRMHNNGQKIQQQSQHFPTNISRRGSTSNVLPPHMTTLKKSYTVANSTTLRRKSSLCYQQQLLNSNPPVNCSTDTLNNTNSEILPARYCPHPNELFLHHQHGKLTLQPLERYDDSLACCLPPPSPAPNSDRFIGGTCVISPLNGQQAQIENHHQPQNYQQQQHTLSASTSNSSISTGVESCSSSSTTGPFSAAFQTVPGHQSHKYNANPSINMNRSVSPTTTRFCINGERYRDINSSPSVNTAASVVIPSSTRHSSSANQYPYQNCTTPLVSNDTYSYLATTVHTPIKRYVPTPPPPSQLFATDQNHTQQPTTLSTGPLSTIVTKCGGGAINPSSGVGSPTVQYRMRPLKCCATDQMVDHQTLVNQTNDSYSSASRLRNTYNCTKTINEIQATNQPPPLNKSGNMMLPTQSSSTTQTHMIATVMGQCGGGTISPQTNAKAGNGARKQIPAYTTRSNLYSGVIDMQEPKIVNQTTSNINESMNQSNACISNTLRNEDVTSSPGTAVGSGSSSTCLHCKTVRRTTGVHQTTQTTGPISPVPQLAPLVAANNNNQRLNDQISNITMTLTPTPTESKLLTPFTPPSTSTIPATNCLHNKKLAIAQDQMFATQLKATSNQIIQSNLSESNKNLQQQSPNMEHCAPTSRTLNTQPQPSQQLAQPQNTTMVQQQQQRYSCKKRVTQYLRREILRFFGIETSTEASDYILWQGRQRRLALRRFGSIKPECELQAELSDVCPIENSASMSRNGGHCSGFTSESQHHHYYHHQHNHHHYATERPDILPIQDIEDSNTMLSGSGAGYNGGAATGSNGRRARCQRDQHYHPHFNADLQVGDHVERKASVARMLVSSLSFIKHSLNKRQSVRYKRRQWSRSFAPAHVQYHINNGGQTTSNEFYEGLSALQDDDVFFGSPVGLDANGVMGSGLANANTGKGNSNTVPAGNSTMRITSVERQLFITGERSQQGWRTSNIIGQHDGSIAVHQPIVIHSTAEQQISQQQQQHLMQQHHHLHGIRGNRISAQLLDGVLENSQRPVVHRIRKFCANDLDDRTDHRPFFTYWINTVQIIVLFLSLLCYGIGPIGFGVEQRTGQVLVPSLSLQTVQHSEQRNLWVGPRSQDLVHMGAKFATCMRRDVKIVEVLMKTRRQERETACCIRNDDSGCVQSSQADCSVRGLFPTKSISTWKKWSPGESGPGGRISGSVCGLDPKYCDAPASIAPYEWPDDITKWPICRKTNSFSQRFRFKDHTAEHMVCEVIGHPCCKGLYGECQITTREYCDFVNGNFHEEASLCSQISCLSNVCGMFPFMNVEVPDQFYRLLTSLCMHAGIVHLAITVIFQHVFLADLERLIGPIRTAILYIGSGLAGNLTSAVLVPYEPEVGPLASLSGVISSLVVLLILAHWEKLHKPHIALFKLIIIGAVLFAIGTLPWQLNFAGLFAGLFCGIFLTIAFVPFVSIKKYRRKSKINLIWSCIIFHIFIYATMLIIFYIFPTELTKLSFGEVLTTSFNKGVADGVGVGNGNGISAGSPAVISTDVMRTGIGNNNNINRHSFIQQQPQYHYHHHSDDIITSNAAVATTNIAVGASVFGIGNESDRVSKIAISL